MDLADLVQPLVSLISGGLAGATVNAAISARKKRLDVTLSVIKDFFSLYDDIGKVKGFFTEDNNLSEALDIAPNLQMLRRIGDWFHYVASLCKGNVVDQSLLQKVGIIKEVTIFSETIGYNKSRSPRHLNDAWAWWENLQNFGK